MKAYLLFILAVCFLLSCEADTLPGTGKEEEKEEQKPPEGSEVVVNEVEITGSAGEYRFNVNLSSPDTGCDQYADWWEVFLADGTLVHRRILAHSHVSEQPFSRSGGPMDIQPEDSLYVRGHMNNLGYGTQVFSGTILDGLNATIVDQEFFKELADQAPQPGACVF